MEELNVLIVRTLYISSYRKSVATKKTAMFSPDKYFIVRCAAFPLVPPQCQMKRSQDDVCCFVPVCDFNQTAPTLPPPVSPGVSTQLPPLPPCKCYNSIRMYSRKFLPQLRDINTEKCLKFNLFFAFL